MSNWNHVPTKLNSADLLSLGSRADSLAKYKLWFEGPEFLAEGPSLWPNHFKGQEMKEEEIKMFEGKSAECVMIYESVPAVDKLISCFSNYYRLKRAVVWLSFGSKPAGSSVTVSSLQEAELDLVRYEQVQSFG